MFYLKRNLYHWERGMRLGAGLLLGVAAWRWLPGGWMAWAAAASAAGLAGTALVGFCPACALAGRRLRERTE